ncbi:hypothetical protein [Streptomyces hydrogenans]|uniref:hypothetical protein n=1 Tax=Streptomyces hydrogenans TaxID=1873719 RepID=UPI003829C3AB
MNKDDSGLTETVAAALGGERAAALTALAGRVAELRDMSEDAATTDVLLVPLDGRAAQRWERMAQPDERWVYLRSGDGTSVLAVDEASEAGLREPAAAVVYPELHMRMVSWWLVHAWRSADLLEDTLESLTRWRITSGAVTARAVIEEAGSLVDEVNALTQAWRTGKAAAVDDDVKRPVLVREALGPVLLKAALGSRMKGSHDKLQATNVLTLLKKLTRATGEARFPEWYDLLSDAAHPAFGARIALATPPLAHPSEAVTVRTYARAPMALDDGRSRRPLEPTVALAVADAVIAAGTHLLDALEDGLAVVDDFGLTTAAATLTRRTYWRDFQPVRGSRACPCGRGKWSACGHRWGQETPGRALS